MLRAVIAKHLKKWRPIYPETVQLLEDALYVDDWVAGSISPEIAQQRIEEAQEIFEDAGMKLRRWMTNDADLQEIYSPSNEN